MVVTAPALIADLMRQGGGVDAFEVIAELPDRRDLAAHVRRLRPDLVIIGLHRGESLAAVETILFTASGVVALTLADDGPRAVGYELRVHGTDLTDFSPAALAAFVRAALARAPGLSPPANG
jgi:DNA-binding NarL/FixJ family response regulator